MFDFEEFLERIESKVKIVTDRLEEAERSRDEWKEKFDELQHAFEQYKARMEDSSEVQTGGLSDRSIETVEAGNQGGQHAKDRIDQYILEIDQCIEMLNEL